MTLDQIRARALDCRTYNFGMRNADKLAHEDAPLLLSMVEDVLALHIQDEQGKCAECTVAPFSMNSVKYPCPTVRTITNALEGTK